MNVVIVYPLCIFIFGAIVKLFSIKLVPEYSKEEHIEYCRDHSCDTEGFLNQINRAQSRAFHYYNEHQKENCWCGR